MYFGFKRLLRTSCCTSAVTACASILLIASTSPVTAEVDRVNEQTDQPNIVLIVADDVAPQLCGFDAEGKGRGFTPNLDTLAADGVVLGNLHSPSPICTPSRFSILTGHYPSRATNAGFLADTRRHGGQTAVAFNTHLDPGDNNLAKRLQAAGYTTGAVGKNHVIEVPGHQRLPYKSSTGDDRVKQTLQENAEHLRAAFHAAGFDYAEALYFGNPDADGIRELAMHNQEWITDAAQRFIVENHDRPFFLYMATTIPHGPHSADRSWNGDPRVIPTGYLEELPEVQPARDTIPKRLQDAGIKGWNRENVLWMDDAVGSVVAELERQGVKQNTIIIFISDHGTEAKGSVYSRGTRTVGLIWRDGGFAVGPVADQAMMLPDLAPTILNWAQVETSDTEFDGRDMSPVLNGEADRVHDTQYFEVGFTRAVVKDGFKYVAVRYPQWAVDLSNEERQRRLNKLTAELEARDRPVPTTDPMAPYSHLTVVPGGADAEQVSINKHPAYFAADQLYDLNQDPTEQRNLADEPAYTERLTELKELLNQKVETLPGHFAEFGRSPATVRSR
ncbi:MAG: sulfatase-like hydrolase/transferase [Planctomycetota bacterium]